MKDTIIKALMADGNIRVMATCTEQIVQGLKEMHNLSNVATAAIGRTVSATLMMGLDLKNEEDLITTIIKGDGPLGGLVVCVNGALEAKGYVYNGQVEPPLNAKGKLDVGGAIGEGTLTVIQDMGMKEPYSGQISLVSGEIAEDFTYYFMVSQQQPSAVALGVLVSKEKVLSSGGIIIQPMPGCPEDAIKYVEERLDQVANFNSLLYQGLEPFAIIETLFPDLNPKFLEEYTPSLNCGCNREKLESVILGMGKAEIEDMIQKDNGAQVHCTFCNQTYEFSAEELERLLQEATL